MPPPRSFFFFTNKHQKLISQNNRNITQKTLAVCSALILLPASVAFAQDAGSGYVAPSSQTSGSDFFAKVTSDLRWSANLVYAQSQENGGDTRRCVFAVQSRALLPQRLHVATNAGTASEWFPKAEKQDFVPAQIELANCYDSGASVPAGRNEAAAWLLRVAEKGFARTVSLRRALHEGPERKRFLRNARRRRNPKVDTFASGGRSL